YHSLMLVDMLDMYNLSRAYPTGVSSELASLLRDNIPKMLNFMSAMAHPDGGVSFFNDSVNGIAPTKTKIESYAKKLGFTIVHSNHSKFEIIDNANCGYFCATAAGNKMIFDASPVGADYIPGHAHADTLSFELSIDTQRVFVNSGTSEYGLSLLRHNQRKTYSHNTVEIDGRDSSQVWSSFRVGNRANIVSRYAELNHNNNIVLQAAHNGYASLLGGCIHSRKLTLSKNSLIVSDLIQGTFRKAKSRFYFHPDLIVSLENNLLKVKGENFVLHSYLAVNGASLSTSSWYPEFGLAIPNKVLELQFEKSQLEILFTWSKD
ncbi:MAG: heparinase II/III-family protein, partial [Alphaproteobacteria bacterium]|nr:heparinase II/III-family protein [Alphaproteobacteria bacterium]